jgi:hypothetical protein
MAYEVLSDEGMRIDGRTIDHKTSEHLRRTVVQRVGADIFFLDEAGMPV